MPRTCYSRGAITWHARMGVGLEAETHVWIDGIVPAPFGSD